MAEHRLLVSEHELGVGVLVVESEHNLLDVSSNREIKMVNTRSLPSTNCSSEHKLCNLCSVLENNIANNLYRIATMRRLG